jgi:uncharacterized surface protein with fasciclin (FAS1) repeats
MKSIWNLLGVVSLGASVAACSSSSSPLAPSSAETGAAASGAVSATAPARAGAKPGPLTIVGIVLTDDGEFDVLQAAVIRAGLAEALNGRTQYTVFAPTDAAFARAFGGSEQAALETVATVDLDTLKNILLFHVTNGRRTSSSVLAAPEYQMLNGQMLSRSQLSAAGLAETDVSASNGIVHVIDSVLLPAS